MFIVLIAIMDSVLASGQPFYRMSDANVQLGRSAAKRMEKAALTRGKTKVNRTLYAVHP